MNAGTSFVSIARAAWGDAMPDWVLALAEEVDRTSQTAAARRIGYTSSVVSGTLANNYKGKLQNVEDKVRAALMGATVWCPELDEIPRSMCFEEQAKPGMPTSPLRMRIWRACRAGCPHSKQRSEA